MSGFDRFPQAAEEKQKRKSEKKAAMKTDGDVAASAEDSTPLVFDGVSSVRGKAMPRAQGKAAPQLTTAMEVEEDEVLTVYRRDLPDLKSVLGKADVVLYVLDARDPLAHRSSHLEQLVLDAGKKMVFVLNKIGACLFPFEQQLAGFTWYFNKFF